MLAPRLRREVELPRPRPQAAAVLLVLGFSMFSAMAASAFVLNVRAFEAARARARAHAAMPHVVGPIVSRASMRAHAPVPMPMLSTPPCEASSAAALESELDLLAEELGRGDCIDVGSRVQRLELMFPDAKLFFKTCPRP